jgi:DNA-binding response OmpR family regulator
MPDVLIATDAPWLDSELRAVLARPDTTIRSVQRGADVLPGLKEQLADLVILDLQIGNMGGMAICHQLRLEEGAGRLDHSAILMLLDRRADVFLARRTAADGWLVKPLDPIRLRRATAKLLAGGTYYDSSYQPHPVLVEPPSDTIASTGK